MDSGTAGSKQERCNEISIEVKIMLIKTCWKQDLLEKNIHDPQPAEEVGATKCSQNSASRRSANHMWGILKHSRCDRPPLTRLLLPVAGTLSVFFTSPQKVNTVFFDAVVCLLTLTKLLCSSFCSLTFSDTF